MLLGWKRLFRTSNTARAYNKRSLDVSKVIARVMGAMGAMGAAARIVEVEGELETLTRGFPWPALKRYHSASSGVVEEGASIRYRAEKINRWKFRIKENNVRREHQWRTAHVWGEGAAPVSIISGLVPSKVPRN